MTARGQIVKAMVIIQRPRDGALLVSESHDPAGAVFHRPLGGHVEIGERAADTARREITEEIGQQLEDLRQLDVLENIFQWDGETQHEVVFMFAARLADEAAYEIAEQHVLDSPDGRTRVIWRPPGATTPPLYPVGTSKLVLG